MIVSPFSGVHYTFHRERERLLEIHKGVVEREIYTSRWFVI